MIPNWRHEWETQWVPIATELLRNGTIVGFFLGDELMWNGLPYESLLEWSNAVRASFPSAFIWQNEAYPTYACAPGEAPSCPAKGGNGALKCCSAYRVPINITHGIPPALNATSVDIYDWSNSTSGRNLVPGKVRPYYESQLYPRAHPGQRFFQVPGSASSTHNAACDAACYEAAVMHDADEYLRWLQEDPLVAGMMPWIWKNCGRGCIPPKDEIGTENMPLAKAHWRTFIGPAVLNVSHP